MIYTDITDTNTNTYIVSLNQITMLHLSMIRDDMSFYDNNSNMDSNIDAFFKILTNTDTDTISNTDTDTNT